MSASPFAFLRGGALLFDECLRREGSWAKGPTGGGSLVGDLHLENFGVFLADGGAPIFHVNDFDALRDGPWRFDVLRLLTSVLLARPELKASGTQVQELARMALEGHQLGLAGKRVAPPALVLALCRTARDVPRERLLSKHVEGQKLLRDDKHPPAPAALTKLIPAALVKWSVSLPGAFGPAAEQLEVLDVRRRISGTGSLGVERLVVLTRGDARGPWLLDVKEVDFSAERVVEAMRGAVKKPPSLIGYADLGKHQMVIRPMAAGEDKLSLDALEADQIPAMIRFLGAMTGEVHRRLARSRIRLWTPKEERGLLASTRRLAAMHEEAFIDFCALHPA
jgi:uncharacterized protein (DUF2252 family)